MYTLDERELRAATEQGIDDVRDALEALEVWTGLEDLGGCLMAAIAYGQTGTVVVTSDGPGAYVVGSYPGDTWGEGSDAYLDGDAVPLTFAETTTVADTVEAVRSAVAAFGGQK